MQTLSPSYKLKNCNLQSNDTKNRILKYLHQNIDSDTKHCDIISTNDLDYIRDNDYIICPQFCGIRSWIIFFKSNNIYYAINMPKYRENNIYPINIIVPADIYSGTIMEGIIFIIDNTYHFVIDEVYKLSGENQLLKPKKDRLDQLSKCLQYFKRNSICCFYVSQYFDIEKQNLLDLHSKIKSDVKIQELIFYPQIFGFKIYKYTILNNDLKDDIITVSIFNMKKTNLSDVYDLFSIMDNEKIGIALIPDVTTSKMCKQWFNDYKLRELFVKCQFDSMKSKWKPIDLVDENYD
uniref:mRNA capping enzyme adenylation domain-containing protein n=1 Tax=viral metagenome TaxID=1070528 RepID=A0A6C0LRR9_9ZZZZ